MTLPPVRPRFKVTVVDSDDEAHTYEDADLFLVDGHVQVRQRSDAFTWPPGEWRHAKREQMLDG